MLLCATGGAVNTQLAWLGQNLVSFLAASEAYSINPAGDRKSASADVRSPCDWQDAAAATARVWPIKTRPEGRAKDLVL